MQFSRLHSCHLLFYLLVLRLHTCFNTGDQGSTKCKASEYGCDNGLCVPMTKYCNSVDDCGDKSDEPRYCTPCNRTYHGEVGGTYEVELHRPKQDKLPFICHLIFTASGGNFGDLIQLSFESFTLGRFLSFTHDGCPDGDMQISEIDRPHVGGAWCGTSWSPVNYFSETHSLKVTVRLFKLSKDNSVYNFDFKIGYKMLNKSSAVVRYGESLQEHQSLATYSGNSSTLSSLPRNTSYYLGDLISGTYCSRIFSDCDKKQCRLQSPNYPGIYARNLTCYYAVRQHEIPNGYHALVSVKQTKGQLIGITSQSGQGGNKMSEGGLQHGTNNDNDVRKLKVWNECSEVQDYVTIYDGYTTRDPVLLRFCGGGSAIPEAISSGSELLVEFTTSPYGTLMYTPPMLPLHGFQLNVEVKFVEQESFKYAKNKRCEFWIRGSGKGTLESPRHSLSPNTTCFYHLQGHEPGATPPTRYQDLSRRKSSQGAKFSTRYRVWLSVLKYHVAPSRKVLPSEAPNQGPPDCSTRLQIWDGNIRAFPTCTDVYCDQSSSSSSQYNSNLTLLSRYCKDHIPKSCEHTLYSTSPRPCSLAESFLSSTDSLTLELTVVESTTLRPVSFRALYEFVDLHQDGEPWIEHAACSRKFTTQRNPMSHQSEFKFQSPKNVFLFGRGGSPNLTCNYRFEAQRGERVRVTITSLQTNNRTSCYTHLNPDTGRLQCIGNSTAYLLISELSAPDSAKVPQHCLCSFAQKHLPFTFVTHSNYLQIDFQLSQMNSSEDYRHLQFEATYEFIRSPVCTLNRRLSGTSGEIYLRSPGLNQEEKNCEGHAWIIEPSSSTTFLYVKMTGIFLPHSNWHETRNHSDSTSLTEAFQCATPNRVTIHSGESLHTVVCPAPVYHQRHHIVEVFSEGWVMGPNAPKGWLTNLAKNESRNVVIDFIPRDQGVYTVTWLELTRRPLLPTAQDLGPMYVSDCMHRCPELDACINSSLWCDGVEHCPTGYDESIFHCLKLFQLPALYLLLLCLMFLIVCSSFLLILCRAYHHRVASKTLTESELPPSCRDTDAILNGISGDYNKAYLS
uniref:CUB domain-containing protein n=1 Tax=Cacopsylla melanoneura TaxID=428564 RepID=A0A8D8YX57_9HEMI